MVEWSKETFAKNLRRYMEVHDVNQKELAEIVGVSTATINHWVSGKKFPRIDRVERLANYFVCQKSDLIEVIAKHRQAIKQEATRAARIAHDKDLVEMIDMNLALPEDKKKTVKQMIVDYYNAFANG